MATFDQGGMKKCLMKMMNFVHISKDDVAENGGSFEKIRIFGSKMGGAQSKMADLLDFLDAAEAELENQQQAPTRTTSVNNPSDPSVVSSSVSLFQGTGSGTGGYNASNRYVTSSLPLSLAFNVSPPLFLTRNYNYARTYHLSLQSHIPLCSA